MMGFGASSRHILQHVIQYVCITKLLTNGVSFISIFLSGPNGSLFQDGEGAVSLLDASYTNEHKIFREAVRRYFEKEVTPHVDEWEKNGIVPKKAWKDLAAQGFLCPWLPEEYGGTAADFLYSFILVEEMVKTRCGGFFFPLHSDIIVPYIYSFGSDEQKAKWLPGCASGDIITAIAMTEPNAGSDLANIKTTAIKDGDSYIINGQKTFISNGINCDLVIVAAKTDPKANPPYAGVSLIVVEDGTPGFERGRKLEKIGLHSQDTTEMAFIDCRVPTCSARKARGFITLCRSFSRKGLYVPWGRRLALKSP
jgi:acyl-CoA dehydrogenase